MLTLGIRKVDNFVKEQQALGADVRWDGWDMVYFRPSPKGRFDRNGAFRNGVWGFDNRISPDDKGVWNIEWRNIKKSPKRTRV